MAFEPSHTRANGANVSQDADVAEFLADVDVLTWQTNSARNGWVVEFPPISLLPLLVCRSTCTGHCESNNSTLIELVEKDVLLPPLKTRYLVFAPFTVSLMSKKSEYSTMRVFQQGCTTGSGIKPKMW